MSNTTRINYPASKIDKLINKFTCPEQRRRTNSPINFLNPARKNNIFLQNEPNSYHGHPARGSSLSICNISGYATFQPFEPHENRQKNEPKRTQNEPNFSPKLALFFTISALFFTNVSDIMITELAKESLIESKVTKK
jgi:hypothetical protein